MLYLLIQNETDQQTNKQIAKLKKACLLIIFCKEKVLYFFTDS